MRRVCNLRIFRKWSTGYEPQSSYVHVRVIGTRELFCSIYWGHEPDIVTSIGAPA